MKFESINKINEMIKDDVLYTLKAKVTKLVRLQSITIFTIDDGEQTLQLVKYLPGQTAYPDIQEGSLVTFTFKRKDHQGKVQGQIADVKEILPPEPEPVKVVEKVELNQELFQDEDWEKLNPALEKVAEKIKEAINQKRPIIISHHADCDGYSSAVLVEKAILHKIKQRQPDLKFINNYYTRNASKTPFYDVSDATKDISFFQGNFQRTNGKTPLIVILDNGSTNEDVLAIKKVQIFGADVVVVDHHDPGKVDEEGKSETCRLVSAHSNPHLVGLNKEFSTSMLALKLAHFISDEISHDIFTATLGGVSDRCQGKPIQKFIANSEFDEAYFVKLGRIVSLEIFFTKYAYGELPVFDLLKSKTEKRDKLVNLYEDQLKIWEKEVKDMVSHYSETVMWNKFNVVLLDGEKLTMWNDYYSIGKLTGFAHRQIEDNYTEKSLITITFSDSMAVFRVKQSENLFDVNKLIVVLKEKIPHARISGGGHDVAGSIKFAPIAKEEVINNIKDYVHNL